MTRRFKRPEYEATLQTSIQRSEALPMNHRARFGVDGIRQLDLSNLDARYAPEGGEASAPEILRGLLLDGYATGVVSSRKLETGSYESSPLRFIARGLHPDPDTLANVRKTFGAESPDLVVQG